MSMKNKNWMKKWILLATSAVTGGMYLSCMIPWHSNTVNPAAFLGVDPTTLAMGNWPILLVLMVILIRRVLKR